MKIEVNKITESGLLLEEDIPAETWDMDSDNVKFVNGLNISCKFFKNNKEIFVNVYLKIRRLIICSRCLEEVGQIVEKDFTLNYNIKNLGEYLNIDNDIREEILLNFPMKTLCSSDCKGLCPVCGENLNYIVCNCKIKEA